MGASIRQTHFSAGELSPRMWGRTDSPLYRAGLRRMRDFFPSRQGEAVSRPGTILVGQTYANQLARLYPFVVSESEGYLLEFTSLLRIWKADVVVATLNFPWSFTPNADLRFVQSGDVLYVCAKYDFFELRRTGATTFTLGAVDFTRKPIQWQQVGTNTRTTEARFSTETLLAATTTSPERPWRWWVSAVLQDGNGRVFESEAVEVTKSVNASGVEVPYVGRAALGPDRPVKIVRSTGAGAWAGTINYLVKGFNWYRGMGDFSGFIGHSTSELEFTDAGGEPDYTLPHPRTSDPFTIPLPSNPPPAGWQSQDYPLTACFFEDRLWFGGTLLKPNSLISSATGDYINFARPAVTVPSQSLEFELAVRQRETVKDILGLQRLVVLTDAGVYAVGGAGALTPDSVEVRLISEKGSAGVRPVVLEGGLVLYARAKGRGLQLLRRSDSADGLFGDFDVSWPAEHLFNSERVTEMAYQEVPFGLTWMVRADGRLLAMQWNGEVAGFSVHATGPSQADRFESIAVVPRNDEDAVYACVNRNGQYTIERFASRLTKGTWEDGCAVDCAVTFTGKAEGSSPVLAASSVLEGREVWVIAKGNAPMGPFIVTGGNVDMGAAGLRLQNANDNGTVAGYLGLLFQPELELLDAPLSDKLKVRAVTKVGVEVSETRGLDVGQFADRLQPWLRRDAANVLNVPSNASDLVEILVEGAYDWGGRATIKQSLPMPVTVLGITREVDGGG